MNPRFDHVGLTVSDLRAATAFFVGLGLTPDSEPQPLEGEFLDTVIGSDGARVEVVTLHPPDGGVGLELSQFHEPLGAAPGRLAPPDGLGLRNVCFQVDDLRGTVARLAGEGFGLVGGVGEYEGGYLMAYVRGPDEIIVSLAEKVG